jgi:uncharacterized membrane protein YfcA
MVLLVFLGFFLASLFQAITGFGIAIMLVPFLLYFYSVQISTVYGLVANVVLSLLVVISTFRYVNLNLIRNMFYASIPGNIVGLYIIQCVNEAALKTSIGVLTLSLAVLLLFGYKKSVKNEKKAALVVGFLGGAMSSSLGMSGPPVILFGVNQAYEKNMFRASLCAYFLLVSIFSLLIIQLRFNLPATVYYDSLKYIVSIIMGYIVGNSLFKYVPVGLIYKAALVVTASLGLSTLL